MANGANRPSSPGEIVKVTIPITWSVLLIIVVVVFVLFYALWEDARSTIRFLGAASGVAAGILSAIYVGRALQITVEQRDRALTDDKISRAFGFLRRWNDPNFARLRAEWRNLLEALDGKTDAQVWEIIRTNPRNRTVAADVMNFFEEMAYAARSGVADTLTLKKICGSIVERYFSTMRPWVERYRTEKHQPTAYEHFEWLRNQWRSG